MAKRKKPTGQELEKFLEAWRKADHAGKLVLIAPYNVSYDTAKHWVSEEGAGEPQPEPEIPAMRVSLEELLGIKPGVHLDFCSFDIETSNLQADFSILMSAVIKPYGCPPIVFRADSYPSWYRNRANDKEIVRDVAEELEKHAIIIAHYGSKFDIPFMRAKMVKHGMAPLSPKYALDTWRIAKNNFQVSSRRLQNLVHFFDIGEKGSVDGTLWMEAAYNGSKEALDKIVEHNIIDCEVLEKLGCISFMYTKSIPRM